ncbi:MAG: hypothetical protein QM755_07710 [Luteolibacter sp.]
MSDPAERFVDAVSRTITGNAEMQLHVRRIVQEQIAATTKDPAVWEKPAAALDAIDQRPALRHWRWWLWLTVLVVSLICMLPMVQEAINFNHLSVTPFYSGLYDGKFDDAYFKDQLSGTLSSDQQLILWGDISKSGFRKWEALSKRFPDRPDYYAQYACAYFLEKSALPPDFLAEAERLAPDNAWFPALAAAVEARGTVQSRKQSSAASRAHVPKEWDVKDEPRLTRSMELFHKAAVLPRYDSYATGLMKEKLALLPPARDSEERLRNLLLAGRAPAAMLEFQSLSHTIAAKSWLLANDGDKEGFQRLLADWKQLARLQAESTNTLLGGIILQGSNTTVLSNLSEGAARLGPAEQAAQLKKASQQAWADSDARRNRTTPDAVDEAIDNHGYRLAGQIVPMLSRAVNDAPVPTITELEPGRLTEHSIAHRSLCVAAFPTIFLLCGACAVYRFRSGPLIRRLSLRLTATLGPADWAWMFASVIPPLLFHILLYGWTPLGGRDWSIANVGIVVRSIQLTAWLLLTMATPVIVARWRLTKRLPGLAIRSPRFLVLGFILVLGYAAAAIAGIYFTYPHLPLRVAMELFGESFQIPWDMEWPILAITLLLPLLLWWLISLVRALFTRSEHALARQMMTRMLVPAWIFLLLPLALLIPISKAREYYWVPRDTMLQIGPTFTRYEGLIAERLKEQHFTILRLMESGS